MTAEILVKSKGLGGNMTRSLNVGDLADVVWSSGRVFDGLSTGRLDTERFLRSGSLKGVTSRSDLALLKDLRDAAQFVIDHATDTINASYVRRVNLTLSRSAALEPGRYRTDVDRIGVDTPLGRHEPAGMTEDTLEQIITTAMAHEDPREQALSLFVSIARAQPFMDGNKRTAIFVANSVLIRLPEPLVLTIPTERELTTQFMNLLAHAYVANDDLGVKKLLRTEGFAQVRDIIASRDSKQQTHGYQPAPMQSTRNDGLSI